MPSKEIGMKRSGKRVVIRRRGDDEKGNPFFEVRIPDQELSDTILEFSAPVFLFLPRLPPLDIVRSTFEIVMTVWNTGGLTLSVWESRRSYLNKIHAKFNAMLDQMEPTVSYLYEQLYDRRMVEPYVHDPRVVGGWSVLADEGEAGFVLRCAVRLPPKMGGASPFRSSFDQKQEPVH